MKSNPQLKSYPRTDLNKVSISLEKMSKDTSSTSIKPIDSFRKKNLSKFQYLLTQQKMQSIYN
jgi:hypothetical protein